MEFCKKFANLMKCKYLLRKKQLFTSSTQQKKKKWSRLRRATQFIIKLQNVKSLNHKNKIFQSNKKSCFVARTMTMCPCTRTTTTCQIYVNHLSELYNIIYAISSRLRAHIYLRGCH